MSSSCSFIPSNRQPFNGVFAQNDFDVEEQTEVFMPLDKPAAEGLLDIPDGKLFGAIQHNYNGTVEQLKALLQRIVQYQEEQNQEPQAEFSQVSSIRLIERGENLLYASRNWTLIQKEQLGKGGESSVYSGTLIEKDVEISTACAVKVAGHTFSNQTVLLQLLSPQSKKSAKIDHFLHQGSLGVFKHIAIVMRSDADLNHVQYQHVDHPGAFITAQLRDMCDGINSLHRAGLLHRDIKPGNLLINYHNDGKITDFGLLTQKNLNSHRTNTTPFYGAPFIWDNIVAQKNRIGIQTVEADWFAFGRSIQYGVFPKLLKYFGTQYSVNFEDILSKLGPTFMENNCDGNELLNDEGLLKIEREQKLFGNCVLYNSGNNRLIIFPSAETYQQNTLAAIERLKPYRSEKELEALSELAKLAAQLQSSEPTSIPAGTEILERLDALCTSFQEPSAAAGKTSSTLMSDQTEALKRKIPQNVENGNKRVRRCLISDFAEEQESENPSISLAGEEIR